MTQAPIAATIVSAFITAADAARAHIALHIPDVTQRGSREALIADILGALPQMGDDAAFQPVNVVTQLEQDYSVLIDWVIVTLEAARDYIHAVIINGEGPQSGGGTIASGMTILGTITKPGLARPAKALGSSDPVTWTPALTEAIHTTLREANLLGAWMVTITEPGILVLCMDRCPGKTSWNLPVPARFVEPTNTWVLASEELQYRMAEAAKLRNKAQFALRSAQQTVFNLEFVAERLMGPVKVTYSME
ncbi:MAG: hypothetical protein AAB839_02210 [Patescibacteria group bacterium]